MIIGLSLWGFFAMGIAPSEIQISSYIAFGAAVVSFIYSIASYFATPREKIIPIAIIGYVLLSITVSATLYDTGFAGSPFVALWVLTAFVAALFGAYGLTVILAATAAYIILLVTHDTLSTSAVISTSLLSIVPIILGYLTWRPIASGSSSQTNEDRSFSELSSQLDNVSDQSQIVIAAIADGVVSVDSKGVIQLFNPAAQRLLGWGSADAIGLDYRSVLRLLDSHDAPPIEANDPIHQALNSNSQTSVNNFRLQTIDSGKAFVASITTTPIGESGSGAIIVFRDITHENEEERQQAEFISTASHEMRTPVASIEGYLGLVLNPATATIDARAQDYIGKAQAAAKHLGRLFQDLLDVTKADDGRLANNPTVVEVVPFVHDIILGQLPTAQAKGLDVRFPPQPDLTGTQQREDALNRTLSPVYYVNLDADHLREVVGNLVENAIKYTLQGTVIVDIQPDDDALVISVQDSGIGIPKEDLPHLFQKFYRVDNSDTREIGGTGLGLYLSRKLAEALGGKLWVESVYKQGSTFYLKLPRIESSEAEQLKVEQQAAAQARAAQEAAATPRPTPPPAMVAAQAQMTAAQAQAAIMTPTPQQPIAAQPQQYQQMPVTQATMPQAAAAPQPPVQYQQPQPGQQPTQPVAPIQSPQYQQAQPQPPVQYQQPGALQPTVATPQAAQQARQYQQPPQ